uniref:Uncharacterized protein n=1 Tax=uncultured prokaryote TaxID=198431 RepID=A0A0H5QNL6_9ZZZZ|nr:hypothetical protein [uncultured prokaryote]
MPMKVSVILPFTSGRPEDLAVNTWYSNADLLSTGGDEFVDWVRDLYVGDVAETYDGIGRLIAGQVNKAGCILRSVGFNPATGKETSEANEEVIELGNQYDAENLPSEVALCLSYDAGFLLGVPKGRTRGRVFIGPLCNINGTTATNPSRPGATYISDLVEFAGVSAAARNAAGAAISLYSPTDGVLRTIRAFSCDNEWDTQRRRGVEPTSRTIQTVAVTP